MAVHVVGAIIYVGLHQPSDARVVERAFISVNRLRGRRSDFVANRWIMDSGAFSTIATHGVYPLPPEEYADQVNRWASCGQMEAAATQDYMCEPEMLARTGLTITEHQSLTIDRYLRIRDAVRPSLYVMPVLQGYAPLDYARHAAQYGSLLERGAWVGVGSVCKRNASPSSVVAVLKAVREARPDLRLHGFGLKKTALQWAGVTDNLHSCDSMAWSYAARRAGGGQNDVSNALRWLEDVSRAPVQTHLEGI